VFKDPITDKGKRSKRGLLGLIKVPVFNSPSYEQVGENYHTVSQERAGEQDLLKLRFRNGELFNQTTFAEVRERANKPFQA
jgi:nicotinamide phosphoribosyltransferase